jgi:hypothetical protein
MDTAGINRKTIIKRSSFFHREKDFNRMTTGPQQSGVSR